jgi:hypothetical protein
VESATAMEATAAVKSTAAMSTTATLGHGRRRRQKKGCCHCDTKMLHLNLHDGACAT